jgi:hypothetical protein
MINRLSQVLSIVSLVHQHRLPVVELSALLADHWLARGLNTQVSGWECLWFRHNIVGALLVELSELEFREDHRLAGSPLR